MPTVDTFLSLSDDQWAVSSDRKDEEQGVLCDCTILGGYGRDNGGSA